MFDYPRVPIHCLNCAPATWLKVRLLRDARPPIFQDAETAQLTSPVPVAWDQLRAIRDRKAMEIAKGIGTLEVTMFYPLVL